MTNKTRPADLAGAGALPGQPESPPPDPKLWAKKLAAVCADLLALCGEIDPGSGWLVNHKDDVTLELIGAFRKRPS